MSLYAAHARTGRRATGTLAAIPIRIVYSGYGRAALTRAGLASVSITEEMASIGTYGFNVNSRAVLSGFGANYPSDIVPRRGGLSTNFIAESCAAQVATGVATHPWVECLTSGWQDSAHLADLLTTYRANGWMMWTIDPVGFAPVDASQRSSSPYTALSPAVLGARERLVSVIAEMVAMNPSIEGIVLDYMRYPDYTDIGCYSNAARAWFESWSGAVVADWPLDCRNGSIRYEEWKAFHTYLIDSLVAEIAAACRAIKPSLLIGCSPFPTKEKRIKLLQYPENWAAAGSIDYYSPQIYTHLTPLTLQELLAEAEEEMEGVDCALYPIIYTADTAELPRDPDVVASERYHLRVQGYAGYAEFAWVTGYENDYSALL
jgi:uncharacterized lipoprotein YddW (UPF0748 family)